MPSNSSVKEYYDKLAPSYDSSRFAGTYGEYIDSQEKKIVSKILINSSPEKTLDIGCGTGRFLEFADFGADVSPQMIEEAKRKYPNKKLSVCSASETGFSDGQFKDVISFHVLMHLEKSKVSEIIDEAHRILEKGGRFLIDIPSTKRRSLVKYKSSGWHGTTSYSLRELKELTSEKWRLNSVHGVLFFPIHRIPRRIRKLFVRIDSWLGRSIFSEYSSYLFIELLKK